jgi:hydroxymethylpyrimidine pyrophosphatase-like HAD family hydrolase
MYLIAFATDYDGTLAHHGRVDAQAIAALERLKASGRTLLMVTGRELPDLKRVFERVDLFDMIVAENGSLLYVPGTQEERAVAAAPPPELVQALRSRGVEPLSVGHGIVATWEPHETTVLECIRDLGLEWQIIFNKGAVMVLPPGINKATGLAAALQALELSPLNVLAIGDAENDHAFLTASGCAVAVANALDAVKETADVVTSADHGAGVIETIDALLADERAFVAHAAERRKIALGDDEAAVLRPAHGGILIAGSSGIGKSTLATAIMEKLAAEGFQICVFDPEGDYDHLEDAIVLGDARRPPVPDEVLDILRKPVATPLVVNMLGLPVQERPGFFVALLAPIQQLRRKTARPHWLVIDEAHHMLPADSETADSSLPNPLSDAIYVTVHPEAMRPKALADVQTVIGVGPKAGEVMHSFCRAVDSPVPETPPAGEEDQVLFWNRASGVPPRWVGAERPRQARKRHTRKYAEGQLGEDRSFYFRGPAGALNLRAHNLMIFLQMADGVDDDTWLYHLHRGDVARWFRDAIKDDDLAQEAESVQDGADPAATREQVRAMVERRYSAPAEAS